MYQTLPVFMCTFWTHPTSAQTAGAEDAVRSVLLTIIEGVHQLAWIDLGSTDQNVVQRPLRALHPGNHNPVADHKRLPPAKPSCVGEGVLREEDVVVPHRNVFLEIHLVEQSPSNSYKDKICQCSHVNPQTSVTLQVLYASHRNLYPGREN